MTQSITDLSCSETNTKGNSSFSLSEEELESKSITNEQVIQLQQGRTTSERDINLNNSLQKKKKNFQSAVDAESDIKGRNSLSLNQSRFKFEQNKNNLKEKATTFDFDYRSDKKEIKKKEEKANLQIKKAKFMIEEDPENDRKVNFKNNDSFEQVHYISVITF